MTKSQIAIINIYYIYTFSFLYFARKLETILGKT